MKGFIIFAVSTILAIICVELGVKPTPKKYKYEVTFYNGSKDTIEYVYEGWSGASAELYNGDLMIRGDLNTKHIASFVRNFKTLNQLP